MIQKQDGNNYVNYIHNNNNYYYTCSYAFNNRQLVYRILCSYPCAESVNIKNGFGVGQVDEGLALRILPWNNALWCGH